MSAAVAAAFLAGASGVAGAWDVLGALDGGRIARRLVAAAAPLRRAGAEGREPTLGERRRLALLAAGCVLAAGWLVAGALAGAVMAALAPVALTALVRLRRERYAARARDGAAPAARAMAGALAAGRSVRSSIAEAADGAEGAAGRELRLAADALALGAPTAAVLERLRRRAGGGPWNTLTAALLLQRDAGGDLAGLLRDLAASLEAAACAERDARAATAQSRLTARIVAGLPLVAAGIAELGSPGFLAGLLGEPLSLALVVAAALLQVTALVAIRRVTR